MRQNDEHMVDIIGCSHPHLVYSIYAGSIMCPECIFLMSVIIITVIIISYFSREKVLHCGSVWYTLFCTIYLCVLVFSHVFCDSEQGEVRL